MLPSNNRFARWVKDQGGAIALSERLGVTAHSVRGWVHGKNWPSIKNLKKILKASKGALTAADVLNNTGGKVL